MKMAIALVLVCGMLMSMCAHARDASVRRPHWVIILTITDSTTGKRVEQKELDPNMEFDDANECKSMVARVGAIPGSGSFAAALTCRKVGRPEASL
jgi:hypothetical protein